MWSSTRNVFGAVFLATCFAAPNVFAAVVNIVALAADRRADDSPLPGVTIHIDGADSRVGFTGADGSLRVDLAPGRYRLTAEMAGFASDTATICTAATQSVRFVLRVNAIRCTTMFDLPDPPAGDVSGGVSVGTGASALLLTPDGNLVATSTTDAVGHFQIGAVPWGDYELRLSAPGHLPRTLHLKHTPTEAPLSEIELYRDCG